MKKITAILSAVILLFNCSIITNASELQPTNTMPSSQDTEAIDLGDGFTMKYETEETSPIARTTRTSTKTATCEYQGKIIATIKLTATFSFNGSYATCTNATSSYSLAEGWSYSKRSTSYSGDTAKTSARISNGFKYFDIDVTLTCSGTGNMS